MICYLQLIGGSAAKRYSGKNILTLAVFMWSLSTFITPCFDGSIYLLVFLRVLLGVGEGLGKYIVVFLLRFPNDFNHSLTHGFVSMFIF